METASNKTCPKWKKQETSSTQTHSNPPTQNYQSFVYSIIKLSQRCTVAREHTGLSQGKKYIVLDNLSVSHRTDMCTQTSRCGFH